MCVSPRNLFAFHNSEFLKKSSFSVVCNTMEAEFKRLNLSGDQWKLTNVNGKHVFPSFPPQFIIPASMSDGTIKEKEKNRDDSLPENHRHRHLATHMSRGPSSQRRFWPAKPQRGKLEISCWRFPGSIGTPLVVSFEAVSVQAPSRTRPIMAAH